MPASQADRERSWKERGYFIVEGFAGAEVLAKMRDCITRLARQADAGTDILPAFALPEAALTERDAPAEERLAKLFRVHREQRVFRDFCRDPAVLGLLTPILGDDIDCFLSQFIFKHPGALGQPWHQDAWYFPFDRGPQVGLWLAVSESRLDNGPLWVLPGSHGEPVHEVVPDQRLHAVYGYFEIVDHDFEGAIPVLMQPGDLLVFHSHLMHRSTDNEGDRSRAAMVFHYAQSGTVDGSEEKFGFVPPNVDWMPVCRDGAPFGAGGS